MNPRLGVYWYIGRTQSGKTTKALEDLDQDIRATGWPALIIDAMPAKNFMRMRHEKSVRDVLLRLYKNKTHAVYTPTDRDDLAKLVAGVRAGRRVHILWDEGSFGMSYRSISPEISAAVRGWAHSELSFRITTQRPSDIHGDVYACDPEIYCFRVDRAGDLDRLEKEFGYDQAELRMLARGAFLTKGKGWDNEGSKSPGETEPAAGSGAKTENADDGGNPVGNGPVAPGGGPETGARQDDTAKSDQTAVVP